MARWAGEEEDWIELMMQTRPQEEDVIRNLLESMKQPVDKKKESKGPVPTKKPGDLPPPDLGTLVLGEPLTLDTKGDNKTIVEWMNGHAKMKSRIGTVEKAQNLQREWWGRGICLRQQTNDWVTHTSREHDKEADLWAGKGAKGRAEEWVDTTTIAWREVTGVCGFWDGSYDSGKCGGGNVLMAFLEPHGCFPFCKMCGFSTVWKTDVDSTAFHAFEAGQFPECCTRCCRDNSFTSVVPASIEYQPAVQALTDEIRQRRDAALHRSHRYQRSSMEHEEISLMQSTRCQKRACSVASTSRVGFASPERGDPVARLREQTVPEPRVATESRSRQKRYVSYENTAATAAVQCHVQADGLSLRSRPTQSPQGGGRGGVRETHHFDGKTATTVHVRQQPLAQPRKPRAKELAL